VSEGAGDGSGRATGLAPGALTALLAEVAAAPEKQEAEAAPLTPGTLVGRFEIIRELGRGGFGVVYEAKDRDLGRQVAVKLVRPGRITKEEGKVSREAEAIARLAHPNLITLFEVGRSEHGPFLVFELLRGKTLQERMDDGPMPVQEAVHVATEVARGLAHAHADGVIHRDLKPANVFVTNRGQVKILDFGMAHAFGRRRLSGGTPAYMAPEQWEDAPEDERTDVFALGVMLYRMLSGEYPFQEGEGRWASEPATPRKLDVPGAPELPDLVEKMLDPTPTRRPRDGAAVLAALTPIEEKLRARPANGAPPVHARRRKATFGDLLAELKRRHVFRVILGYGVVAFAVLQVTEPIMHGAELPDWVLKAVLLALALGFPVAVVLAWVFDLTAQGVKRTPSGPGEPLSGRPRFLMPLAVSVAVLAISVAGGGAWFAWKRAPERRPGSGVPAAGSSVAVLPFADLSPGKDQEYFADGVAEEVLNGLAQVEGLRVIGRTSAFSFKGSSKRVDQIGRELGVGTVLDGSVRRMDNRLRISAQLVRTSDGTTLWAQTFDRPFADVFAIQDEIARDVITALKARLITGRVPTATWLKTDDPEVYGQYLLGREFFRRGTVDGWQRALATYQKILERAPNYAPAWSGIARATGNLESWVSGEAPAESGELAAAERAIAIAPGYSEGYLARAVYRLDSAFDWSGANEDFQRALALSPGDAQVIASHASLLGALGRYPEAIVAARKATELDPIDPLAWTTLGTLYDRAGDVAGARKALSRALEISPDHEFALYSLASVLVEAGLPDDAIALVERSRSVPAQLNITALARHDLGDSAGSQVALDALIAGFAESMAYQIAQVWARRGKPDVAFAWLDRALRQRDGGLPRIKDDPLFRGLHTDPRWKAFMKKLNLPVD